MRNAPNSTRRAATCARPTRAAAAIAAVVLAPAISRRRGRCAAITPVTNQVAAKTNARIAIAARGAGDASPSISDARTGGGARVISSRFKGSPIRTCSAAQTRHAARQPNCASRKAESGHPTVLAKPAIKVMPVIGPRAARP